MRIPARTTGKTVSGGHVRSYRLAEVGPPGRLYVKPPSALGAGLRRLGFDFVRRIV